MSMLSEAFMGRFGKGDQGPEQRIRFARTLDEMVNTELFTEFGCGRFQDGFLHLFSQDLDVLDPLLETWSFLLPEAEGRRKVIGRNAYGALLILEDFDAKGVIDLLCILDPITLSYWSDPNCVYTNGLGHWLPENKVLPTFLDDRLYKATRSVLPDLEFTVTEILGIKVPLPLGGTMDPANFQVEDITHYYTSMAPIIRQAMGR